MNELRLDNLHGCLTELQDVSRGLAYADHLWHRVIDDITATENTWETYQAEAAEKARDGLHNAATATEVKAAIHSYVERHTPHREARDAHRKALDRKAKLERFLRSLEKRGSHAQAARNGHEQLARAAGNT